MPARRSVEGPPDRDVIVCRVLLGVRPDDAFPPVRVVRRARWTDACRHLRAVAPFGRSTNGVAGGQRCARRRAGVSAGDRFGEHGLSARCLDDHRASSDRSVVFDDVVQAHGADQVEADRQGLATGRHRDVLPVDPQRLDVRVALERGRPVRAPAERDRLQPFCIDGKAGQAHRRARRLSHRADRRPVRQVRHGGRFLRFQRADRRRAHRNGALPRARGLLIIGPNRLDGAGDGRQGQNTRDGGAALRVTCIRSRGVDGARDEAGDEHREESRARN